MYNSMTVTKQRTWYIHLWNSSRKWVLYSAKSNWGRVDRDFLVFMRWTDINFR